MVLTTFNFPEILISDKELNIFIFKELMLMENITSCQEKLLNTFNAETTPWLNWVCYNVQQNTDQLGSLDGEFGEFISNLKIAVQRLLDFCGRGQLLEWILQQTRGINCYCKGISLARFRISRNCPSVPSSTIRLDGSDKAF